MQQKRSSSLGTLLVEREGEYQLRVEPHGRGVTDRREMTATATHPTGEGKP